MRQIPGPFPVVLIATLAALPVVLPGQAPNAQKSDAIKKADAAFHAGYAAQQAGQLDRARAKFAEAVRLAPAIAEAHEALGAVLLELDKPAEAVPELEAALRLKPGDPGIETDLAMAYARTGEPAKAIPHFSAAFAVSQQPGQQPADALFCETYARALAAIGKLDEAIGMFRAAEERGGSGPALDDAVGSLYAQTGNWGQARSEFEHAVAADKTYVPARIHLGILLRQQNDVAGSLAALAAAVELEPANALAHLEDGRSLAAANRDE